MAIKSRTSLAYIFIVGCLSPFYLASYFQGLYLQKLYLKQRLWGDLDIFWLAGGGRASRISAEEVC